MWILIREIFGFLENKGLIRMMYRRRVGFGDPNPFSLSLPCSLLSQKYFALWSLQIFQDIEVLRLPHGSKNNLRFCLLTEMVVTSR
jgi:hypothetical protein